MYGNQFEEIFTIVLEKDFNLKSKIIHLSLRKVDLYSSILTNIARKESIRNSAIAAGCFILGNQYVRDSLKGAKAVNNVAKTTLSGIGRASRIMRGMFSNKIHHKNFVEACKNGNYKIAKVLLKTGAEINTPHSGVYPISVAAASGNIKLVKMLLVEGAKINDPRFDQGDNRSVYLKALSSNKGTSPLSAICGAHGMDENVRYQIAELLIENGAKLQTNCLYAAVHYKNIELVKLVLKSEMNPSGIDPNDPRFEDRSPLSHAAQKNSYELVQLLLNARANPNPSLIRCWCDTKSSRNGEKALTKFRSND